MKILSLFDGMACGMLAMQKAGVEVDEYIAYEIDKYAIQTSSHNFPMIQHEGNVFDADFTKWGGYDYLIGGSPCTFWSIAQKNNRETEASGLGWELFSQYVRALNEVKPRYFIYENNKSMSNAIRESISSTFGFEPICINSALVSAQNRQRLYWVGKRNEDNTYSKVDIQQPHDKGIRLKEILDSGEPWTDKSYAYTTRCHAESLRDTAERHRHTMVANPVNMTAQDKAQCLRATCYKDGIRNIVANNIDKKTGVAEPVCVAMRGRYSADGSIEQHYEARQDGKTNVITKVEKDNRIAEPVGTTSQGKSYGLKAQYSKNGVANFVSNGGFNATAVGEPVRVGSLPRPSGELSQSQGFRIYDIGGKSVGLKGCSGGSGGKTGLYATPTEFDGDAPVKAISQSDGKTYTVYEVRSGQITIKGKQYPIKLDDGYYIVRKLSVPECKRLQTVPEWYEFPVSNSQAYKMLGNGWTVDVIAHLIEATLPHERR